jgi:prepilin-type N-terminal cleavage/methylation domain-containing protein
MKNFLKKKNLQSGFTLIELLVVIAIIAILSAIIILDLNSARGKAVNARVESEMSDLGAQMELYYDDNGGYIPSNQTSVVDCTTGADPFSGTSTDDATNLIDGIAKDVGAGNMTCYANAQSWSVFVNVPGGLVWCSDSNGDSGSSNPATGTTYTSGSLLGNNYQCQ